MSKKEKIGKKHLILTPLYILRNNSNYTSLFNYNSQNIQRYFYTKSAVSNEGARRHCGRLKRSSIYTRLDKLVDFIKS